MLKKVEKIFLDENSIRFRAKEKTHPWYMVMWLTGVDYFSSLAYQAGIALLAAGIMAPIATAILVAVTLFCCVPIYFEVSRRSFTGQGSIAMLENLLPGWWGKVFVLVLLGFAGTDFVITMTLSAADAAVHIAKNPYLHAVLGHQQYLLDIALLGVLALVFFIGFSEAIKLAVFVGLPFVVLNCILLFYAVQEIFVHPEFWHGWRSLLAAQGDWHSVLFKSFIVFPGLALGLSGFETGMSVMPLIEGEEKTKTEKAPLKRIANTRKLLFTAALIMSVLLMASSFAGAILIPESAYKPGGEAEGRAMAWLAHKLLGNVFGSFYDFSTIAILWFAGASAMAGMLNLIPRYLPRYGMAPEWVLHRRPLIIALLIIDVIITVIFHANVEKQSGAYATGVLALILSAAIAATLVLWMEYRNKHKQWSLAFRSAFYAFSALIFAYTLCMNIHERPDGIIIASVFIALLLVMSIISRYHRSMELRVEQYDFSDKESEELWKRIKKEKINIVPVKSLSSEAKQEKENIIRKYFQVEGPIAFLQVHLMDDRSEFMENIYIKLEQAEKSYIIKVYRANVVANTIAFMSTRLAPRAVFIGLTRRNFLSQSLRYFVTGMGEIGLLVYEIMVRHWEDKPDEVRPLIFLMSK